MVLEPTKLYRAQVTASLPRRRKVVVQTLDPPGQVLECSVGGNIMGSLFGIQMRYYPPVGTGVWVAGAPNQATILGCVPAEPMYRNPAETASGGYWTRDDSSMFDGELDNEIGMDGAQPPEDLIEGEVDMTSAFGAGIRLMTTVAKLQAGERARFEALLMDDLARIVAANYRKITEFGDEMEYNDGALQRERHFSALPHESYGLAGKKDPLSTGSPKNAQEFSEGVKKVARYRFSEYEGFIGDLVHQFVSDPMEGVGRLATDALRSGKYRKWIGADGSLLVQSISEIAIEKVSRVTVPIQTSNRESMSKVRAEYDKLNEQFIQSWQGGWNTENLSQAVFRIREYSRWFAQFYSYARFLQLEAAGAGFRVPSEDETPEPSWGSKFEDREAVGGLKYLEVYATMRIMRDGSILHLDGYGNAYCSGMYGVQIGSTTDLYLNAARDVNVVAGRDINMKARRSLEFVAVVGGLLIRTRTWLRALCDVGSVRIASGAKLPADTTYEPPEGMPEAEVLESAVVIEAPNSGMKVDIGRGLKVLVRGNPEEENANGEPSESDIVLQTTNGTIRTLSKHFVSRAVGIMVLRASSFKQYCSGIFIQSTQFVVKNFIHAVSGDSGSGLFLRNLKCQYAEIKNLVVNGNPEVKATREIPVKDDIEDMPNTAAGDIDERFDEVPEFETLASDRQPALKHGDHPQGLEVPQPHAQQRMVVNEIEDDSLIGTWNWASDDGSIAEGMSVEGKPWPGTGAKSLEDPAAPKSMSEPETAKGMALHTPGRNMRKKMPVFRYVKDA